MDRFMFKVLVDYPGREEEIEVLKLHDSGSVEEQRKLEAVLSVEELKYLRDKVKEVRVDEKMKAFIVDIVATTRHNGWLYLGSFPAGFDCFDEQCQSICRSEWPGFCCS